MKKYKLFATPTKTAKENNLLITKDFSMKTTKLFDLTLLEELSKESILCERVKESIIQEVLKNISPANKISYTGDVYDNFSAYNCEIKFKKQQVYSNTKGKTVYFIFTVSSIIFREYTRSMIYNDLKLTETIEKSINEFIEDYQEIA